VLLPLPEPRLLKLDLLSESLPEQLLLFAELRVVKLLDLGLAKLARLHLRQAVRLVVVLLGARDEIQHVAADEQAAELDEVAVLRVLHCGSVVQLT